MLNILSTFLFLFFFIFYYSHIHFNSPKTPDTKAQFCVCFRPRGPVDFVHRRVRRRQDREHEESDSIFGLRGRVETQVQRGKSTSISTYIIVVVVGGGGSSSSSSGDGGGESIVFHARARSPKTRVLDELNHRGLYEPFNLPMLPQARMLLPRASWGARDWSLSPEICV